MKALSIRVSAYGENHIKVAESHYLTGVAYAGLGEIQSAFGHFDKALDIILVVGGLNHHLVATIQSIVSQIVGAVQQCKEDG